MLCASVACAVLLAGPRHWWQYRLGLPRWPALGYTPRAHATCAGPLEPGKLSEKQQDMLRVGTALRNIGWLRYCPPWLLAADPKRTAVAGLGLGCVLHPTDDKLPPAY